MINKKVIVTILSIAILPVYCSGGKNTMEVKGHDTVTRYYREVKHTAYGIPELSGMFDKKPHEPGIQFIAALYNGQILEKYYHILAALEENPDIRKPFRVIYEWTGRGFDLGYRYSKDIIEKTAQMGSGKPRIEPFCSLILLPGYVLGSAIFITTSVGGFIVGVTQFIPATFGELKKLGISDSDLILGAAALAYDRENRIVKITSLSPPPEETPLAETEFFYTGMERKPHKSINYSIPEKKSRIIYGKQ